MHKYILVFFLPFILFFNHSSAETCKGSDHDRWHNCIASFVWDDGAKYEGRWANGKMNGFGIYTFAEDNTWSTLSYEGFYKNDDMHGFGKITWTDGGYYEGDFHNNDPHGYGTHTYASGNKYEGHYQNGRPHGQGKFIWNDGSWYLGAWKNGDFDGFGKYKYVNGDLYEGFFKTDLRHGQGKMIYADGSTYEGEWSYDKKVEATSDITNSTRVNGSDSQCPSDSNENWTDCFGDYTFFNENRYIGSWMDNEENGDGAFYFPNGEKLSGNFENGLLQGKGRYYFKNGDIYIGDFKNSLMHGAGEIVHGNDSIIKARWYEGEIIKISIQFVNNESGQPIKADLTYATYCPNRPETLWNNCFGRGKMSNEIIYKGIWKEDRPEVYGELYHNEKLEYRGDFLDGYIHGKGKLFLSHDMIYEGEFEYGVKQGPGVVTQEGSDRKVYLNLNNGVIDGEMVAIDTDGKREYLQYEYDIDIFQNEASAFMLKTIASEHNDE